MMALIRIFRSAAFALAIPAIAAAQTGPQFSTDEILKHFSQDPAVVGENCPEGGCLEKAGTRAVCLGTASDCAAQQVNSAKADAFDLLITFEIGSDELSPQARANLEEFANALRHPTLQAVTFNLDGHTDARGSDRFNQILSERRATTVVKYLESLGIERARLSPEGHGESLLRNAQDPFAEINRRVEATIRTR